MTTSPRNITSEDIIKETFSHLKTFTKEFQKEQEKVKSISVRAETISDNWKTTLHLINPEPQAALKRLTNEINNYISTTKIEAEFCKKAIENISSTSNTEQILKRQFKEKVHQYRESELSILLQRDPNLKSIYYIAITFLTWFILWVIVNTYQRTGKLVDYLFWNEIWKGIPGFFNIYYKLVLYSFLIVWYIQCVKYFTHKYKRINYYILFITYALFQAVIPFFVLSNFMKFASGLPAGTSMGAEMVRIMLKVHSYFREKVWYGWKEYHWEYATFSPSERTSATECTEITIENFFIEFKRFTYYFFCPSWIYRDKYPRLPKFRLGSFINQLMNFIFCITFFYIFAVYFCEPFFNLAHIKNYYNLLHFINDALHISIPSSISLIIAFSWILHTWMNLWSELLCHGDRRFYEDWWSCTNFEQYFRKWNMIVHEWLYYYVYNDIRRLSLGKHGKLLSKFLVFLLSVVIHEIIVCMGIGFFYPILSFFFGGPGILFTYIKTTKKEYNIVFWWEMILGPGIIVILYWWEFNLRRAFKYVEYEQGWHEYAPKIIVMFLKGYKEKLIAIAEKYN